jgi:hypothetical protein
MLLEANVFLVLGGKSGHPSEASCWVPVHVLWEMEMMETDVPSSWVNCCIVAITQLLDKEEVKGV